MNTPKDFIDYIQNTTFDINSLQIWELETLSSYLGLYKKEADLETTIRGD